MQHKRVFIFIGCLPSRCRTRVQDLDRLSGGWRARTMLRSGESNLQWSLP